VKHLALGSAIVVGACASGPAPGPGLPLPDWRGPAVHCRHLGDGGLEVELVAPTAGHRIELVAVQSVEAGGVEVVLRHALPTADFVAQVVTPLCVTVPAERLGAARWVAVRIASAAADAATQLAIATARPGAP